jgi:NAD(P)H-nitrite reductase large subunit
MDATRAGKGCGSCKNLVAEVVLWFCGGEVEEDPSIHYYVPSVPLTKPQLIAAVHEQNLKSVSAVFRTLAGGNEDAGSKPALASLLASIWNDEYVDERDARFINERVHGTGDAHQFIGRADAPRHLRDDRPAFRDRFKPPVAGPWGHPRDRSAGRRSA